MTEDKKQKLIDQLTIIAEAHDEADKDKGDKGAGDAIRQLINDIETGKKQVGGTQSDGAGISLSAKVTIEKFDGPGTEGKQPVEVKEFLTEL
jgi:hypothetical protein